MPGWPLPPEKDLGVNDFWRVVDRALAEGEQRRIASATGEQRRRELRWGASDPATRIYRNEETGGHGKL